MIFEEEGDSNVSLAVDAPCVFKLLSCCMAFLVPSNAYVVLRFASVGSFGLFLSSVYDSFSYSIEFEIFGTLDGSVFVVEFS